MNNLNLSSHNAYSFFNPDNIKNFLIDNVIIPFKQLDQRVQLAIAGVFGLIALIATYPVGKRIYVCLLGRNNASIEDKESSISSSSSSK